MLKRILYSVITLVAILLISIPLYISYWRNSSTINTFHSFTESEDISFANIKWVDDFLGKEKIEKIAFHVPVQIEGLKENLFMQFDSGTQTTLIYGKTLNELIKSNSTIETFYDLDSLKYIKNPIVKIAENQFTADKLRIATSLGDTVIDSTKILIGTIGFDAFVNRTLILDFKNDKLAITKKSAAELDYNLNYIDNSSVNKFPLLIPAKIGNKKTKLFYDTGSSMFSLITSNERLENMNANKTDSLCCISNWGRQLPVYRKKLNIPIEIGDSSFDNQSIYGSEVLNMVNYIPSWYLFGMTGNRLFNDKIVVIDTKNNAFGIEN